MLPAEEAPRSDGQDAPSHTSEPVFHLFPRLPAELQISIWQEAAAFRRVVFAEPETAHTRSINRETIPDRVPPLLHVNHQSRQTCLRMYKTRFQFEGDNNLWETYILADHDILVLRETGLLQWTNTYKPAPETEDPTLYLSEADVTIWFEFCEEDIYKELLDLAVFRAIITPGIRKYIQTCLQPPNIPGVRGNISSVKRLIVLGDCHRRWPVEATWPGLYRDPDILAALDQALPAAAKLTSKQNHRENPVLDAETLFVRLAARYHCQSTPCPHHPAACNGKRPGIAIARTPIDHGQWLATLSVTYPRGRWRHILGNHHMVMWCFEQPRYLAEPLPEDADETERWYEACANYLQAQVWGTEWQISTIYGYHTPGVCKWLGEGGGGGEEGEHCWQCLKNSLSRGGLQL